MAGFETSTPFFPILKIVIILFAIIGIVSTLTYIEQWNQQRLISSKISITSTINISSITWNYNQPQSFIDEDGKGYVLDGAFTFSKMDKPIAGHQYKIRYFCNPLKYQERDIMEMIDLAENPYNCINKDGVCT